MRNGANECTCAHTLSRMATKPKIVRMYLNEDAQRTLRALVEKAVDLSEQQICSLLFSASLRAMKEADYTITLPLNFSVTANVPVTPSSRR